MKLRQLALSTWREARDDNVFGIAAQLAYYFLLALFPLLIFLTSAVGFLPDVQISLVNALAKVAPPEAITLVRDTLSDVVTHRSGGLLSFGLIASLWSASSGVASVMDGLNRAHDIKETRPFWRSAPPPSARRTCPRRRWARPVRPRSSGARERGPARARVSSRVVAPSSDRDSPALRRMEGCHARRRPENAGGGGLPPPLYPLGLRLLILALFPQRSQ